MNGQIGDGNVTMICGMIVGICGIAMIVAGAIFKNDDHTKPPGFWVEYYQMGSDHQWVLMAELAIDEPGTVEILEQKWIVKELK